MHYFFKSIMANPVFGKLNLNTRRMKRAIVKKTTAHFLFYISVTTILVNVFRWFKQYLDSVLLTLYKLPKQTILFYKQRQLFLLF